MHRLEPLLGKTVTVTSVNAPQAARWTGRLIAIADGPSTLIQQADGVRVLLPQSHTYAAAVGTEELHAELAAAKATLRAVAAFADEMDGYCSPHGVASLYAERLRERLTGHA